MPKPAPPQGQGPRRKAAPAGHGRGRTPRPRVTPALTTLPPLAVTDRARLPGPRRPEDGLAAAPGTRRQCTRAPCSCKTPRRCAMQQTLRSVKGGRRVMRGIACCVKEIRHERYARPSSRNLASLYASVIPASGTTLSQLTLFRSLRVTAASTSAAPNWSRGTCLR